jgi:non-ribosomal peptide synthetase-like protein
VGRLLAAKNRHNLVTIGIHLLSRWFLLFVLTVVFMAVWSLETGLGTAVVALIPAVVVPPFILLYGVLVERAATGFRPLQPTYCSIYDIAFWRIERLFKNTSDAQVVLNGTPFKAAIWRLLGVRVGRRLLDDGCGMAEKNNMVTIGDDVTLNAGSSLQCHSQEDYAFKNDRITVGSGCTVGVGVFVFYGAAMGDGSSLAADSFLMKGEEVPPHEQWGGNPAREMPAVDPFAPPVREMPPAAAVALPAPEMPPRCPLPTHPSRRSTGRTTTPAVRGGER